MPLGIPAQLTPPSGRAIQAGQVARSVASSPQSGMGREASGGNTPIAGPPAPWTTNPNYQAPAINGLGGPYGTPGPPAPWTNNPSYQAPQFSYWGTPYSYTDPNIANYANQLGVIKQIGAANTQYNTSMGLLNQNQYSDKVNFANQGAALNSQQLGVGQYQDVTLAGQRAQTAFDTAQANYQTTMGQINAQAGLTDAQRAEKIRAARVAHADIIAKLQANYGLDVNDLNLAAGKDTRSNRSSATARGAVGSSGFQTTNNDIANQLASGMNRENSNLQLGTTGANNDFTASNNATDLAYRQNQLQLQAGRDQAAADAKKAADDKAASDKYLASVADQYGIRQDQADLALQSGLSNLGYDAAATTAALAQAQASNNATIAAQAAALTASAIQAGIGANTAHPAAKPPPKPAPKPATGPHVIQS